MTTDIRTLSEQDLVRRFIMPALQLSGWDVQGPRVREQYTISPGRLIIQGRTAQRTTAQFVDIMLLGPGGQHLAVLECKKATKSPHAGMQQALDYGARLDAPFMFSTNGQAFIFHDKTDESGIERELPLDKFPSPGELWTRYVKWKGFTEEQSRIVSEKFNTDLGKEPRYYQRNAVNRVMEAIAQGQTRGLLVMATGTGKTFTAAHIIHKFRETHKTAKNPNPRVLFLVDRNALADQTIAKDFAIFGGVMTKISNRIVETSSEVYVALYQAVTSEDDAKNIYQDFPPDYFDLIVVDECHRSSRKVEGNWRKILDHFKSATQIGLTATPKDDREGSNLHYYGDPLYTYTLQQGIEDGYLAPYQVIRFTIDKDVFGYIPLPGQLDKYGQPIDSREYNQKDFDRNLVIEERTRIVAQALTQHLQATDRRAKTIVFCEAEAHAERMRSALVQANADLVKQHQNYACVITGNAYNAEELLDDFMDPESPYPVIACTAKLLTTGVDIETCKNIVIDQNIESISEFKQIIGRGTRVYEKFSNDEQNKKHFTILDFRNATRLFFDPDFDGQPEAVTEVVWTPTGKQVTKTKEPPAYVPTVSDPTTQLIRTRKQYLDKDGKLITDSLVDHTKRTIQGKYPKIEAFLQAWTETDRKQLLIEELTKEGIYWEDLREALPHGKDLDLFDLVCHIAFDRPPLTRKERATGLLKKGYFDKFGPQAHRVLEAIVEKYADEGVVAIETMDLLKLPDFEDRFGRLKQIMGEFGGKEKYLQAVEKLISELYRPKDVTA